MHEPVYEMLWDCSYCGQTKNLGLTHRFCPSCGAPQQPERRYFPPEDQKIAVQNHQFVGADLNCPACQTPQSARARNCGHCGSPLDSAGAVAKQADVRVGGPPVGGAPMGGAPMGSPQFPPGAATAKPKSGGGAKKGCIIGGVAFVVLACLASACLFFFWKQDKAVTVESHTWRRAIAIERYQTVNDSQWCDSLPPGARVISRSQRQRGTRQVQDGQNCTTRNVDNGDGTFRQVQDCQPRYRQEPTYADHCTYSVERWQRVDQAVAQGAGTMPPPSWPPVNVSGCMQIGCTRAGARTETYTLHLNVDGSGPDTCEVNERRWMEIQDGTRWNAAVGVLSGDIDCDAMTPAR